jgi:hypothetical protein
VDPRYSIVAARPGDVAALGAIELAAAQLLRGHAPDSVLDEVFDEDEFREAQSEGDTPVGFAVVELLATWPGTRRSTRGWDSKKFPSPTGGRKSQRCFAPRPRAASTRSGAW